MKSITRRDPGGNVLNNGEYYSKSNGAYRFSYTDPLGKRRQISAVNLEKLRERENRIFHTLRSELNEYTGGNATLNDLFDIYMGTKDNIRKSTRDNYFYMYDRFVRPRFGTKKVGDYKYTDLLTFYNMLERAGLKYNTLDNIQTVVYPCFQMAMRDGIIPRNPAEGAKTEIRKNSGYYTSTIHPITKEEQIAFLEYIKDHVVYGRWYGMFTFMFGTGVRIGELAAVLWEDIDFEAEIISIRRGVSSERRVSGIRGIVISTPKTGSGIRDIPMFPEVKRELMKLYEQRPVSKKGVVIDGYKGFVFTNRDGGLVNQQSVNRVIRRAVEDYNATEASRAVKEKRPAVLLPHFTTHMIRHSFCSRLCENESNIKIIQAIMGHTDIRTTMEIYAEVSNNRKLQAFRQYGGEMGLR